MKRITMLALACVLFLSTAGCAWLCCDPCEGVEKPACEPCNCNPCQNSKWKD